MRTLRYVILMLGFTTAFMYGLLVGKYQVFPYQYLKTAYQHLTGVQDLIAPTDPAVSWGSSDEYGRLAEFPGKREVACPVQTERTGVLLVIGQSNAGNSAERRVHTRFPERNLNLYNGRCYVSGSPLLGSTNVRGEWITLLGDQLMEQGIYDNIVLIPSAIGGSVIARWADEGDLNGMLMSTIRGVNELYRVTDVVWHQGEGDVAMYTRTNTYVNKFESLMHTLARAGVDAPYFMSIASLCFDIGAPSKNWVPDAQRTLIESHGNIVLGVNTDEVVPLEDRHDGCHFGARGQERVAAELASSIGRYRATQVPDVESGLPEVES
jgi:hypothetical protein